MASILTETPGATEMHKTHGKGLAAPKGAPGDGCEGSELAVALSDTEVIFLHLLQSHSWVTS